MKKRFSTRTTLFLALSLALASLSSATARAGDKTSTAPAAAPLAPTTPAPPVGNGGTQIDPRTGLPMPPPEPWIDPNWKDPDKVLSTLSFDNVPLAEVARDLRDQFKDAFDVLIPRHWQDSGVPNGAEFDPGDRSIRIQLKNVSVSEVFNAMNLFFESENNPLQWQLRMNGKRPVAILRVLPGLIPPVPPAMREPPREPEKRMVYFVGDLVGDEKTGSVPMEELVQRVSEVYQMSYGTSVRTGPHRLQFHKDAQLLILTGTPGQIEFIQETLAALRQKAEMERSRPPRVPETKEKTEL